MGLIIRRSRRRFGILPPPPFPKECWSGPCGTALLLLVPVAIWGPDARWRDGERQ